MRCMESDCRYGRVNHPIVSQLNVHKRKYLGNIHFRLLITLRVQINKKKLSKRISSRLGGGLLVSGGSTHTTHNNPPTDPHVHTSCEKMKNCTYAEYFSMHHKSLTCPIILNS